jgi:hypothetical protein
MNLRNSRVCGVGIFAGADMAKRFDKGSGARKEFHLGVVPLLIGFGGLGRSDANGWWLDE